MPRRRRPRPARPWRTRLAACGLALLGCLITCLAGCLVPAAPAAAAGAAWELPLPRPLAVARPFDPPPDPYGAGHRGVDLRAPAGAPVRAPGPGVVVFAGPVAGRSVVSVDSGGLRFSYEPLRVLVRAGEPVQAGTVLGVLVPGHAGCETCL